MRVLIKIHIPAEAGNEAIRDGSLPKTLQGALEKLRPEAAYFYPEDGLRTAIFVVQLEHEWQLPSVTEPFFGLEAEVFVSPVMTPEDLKKGLELLAQDRR